jgi:hypothetical protein
LSWWTTWAKEVIEISKTEGIMTTRIMGIVALCIFLFEGRELTALDGFTVTPEHVELARPLERAQLLVTATQASSVEREYAQDLTATAMYASSAPQIVSVDRHGQLLAHQAGEAVVSITVAGESQEVTVTVLGENHSLDFTHDIVPILNKAGCAAAACHASQFGKGGFKLSVFGYDPQADFEAIARADRQRRVNFAAPDVSLFLQKPTMGLPHVGGRRLDPESVEYQVMRTWVEAGAQPPNPKQPTLEKLEVFPDHRVGGVGLRQQLQVIATYTDGATRDVTATARYDSMDEGVLSVDARGILETVGRGQTSVMVRYEGQADLALVVVPYAEQVDLSSWNPQNFVDELAGKKFQELGLVPSGLCDDATFVRRAFLDAIGTLPTSEEAREFIESKDPNKRSHLIDRLLGLTGDPKLDTYNDQYAAFWTLKWSDLIRNNSNSLGEQGMWALHNWIRESMRTNKPFDEFVRELVTAQGSIYSNGPANYFRIHNNATALTEATAQIFMGVRLECAKCHHHPFEAYSQGDYYGLAAFFSRVGSKNSEEFGLFGRETVVMVNATGDVRHPKTRAVMAPTPLGGEPTDDALDRRLPLAQWLTSPQNKFFAQSVVNRYVGYLLGQGLVEPIDDLRSTNPPSNPELMEALADHFVQEHYDLRQLLKAIMNSRVYQLSSQPTSSNASDRRFYSHYQVKRLTAEPLLDAIDQVTGVQTKFKSLPLGTRAIELPDAEYPNYFLTTFAKPRRASVCECERPPHESLSQALHTLNGDIIAAKIADKNGWLTQNLAAMKSSDEMIEAIYLRTLSRQPSEEELNYFRQYVNGVEDAKQAYEDVVWALVNSKQFLFVH